MALGRPRILASLLVAHLLAASSIHSWAEALYGAEFEVNRHLARIADRFDYSTVQRLYPPQEVLSVEHLEQIAKNYLHYPNALESLPEALRNKLTRDGASRNEVFRRWQAIDLSERAKHLQFRHFPAREKARYLKRMMQLSVDAPLGENFLNHEAATKLLPFLPSREIKGFNYSKDMSALEFRHEAPLSREEYLRSIRGFTKRLGIPLRRLNHLTRRKEHRLTYHLHMSVPNGKNMTERLRLFNLLQLARLLDAGKTTALGHSLSAYQNNLLQRGLVRLLEDKERFHFEVRVHTKPPEEEIAELERWFLDPSEPGKNRALREMAQELGTLLESGRVKGALLSLPHPQRLDWALLAQYTQDKELQKAAKDTVGWQPEKNPPGRSRGCMAWLASWWRRG